MRLLIFLLPLIGVTLSEPQRNVYVAQNERPLQFVKFSPADIKNLKSRGYTLPIANSAPNHIPAGFRSTQAPDSAPAQTHRRPVYDDDNYPVQNSLPVQHRVQQVRKQIPLSKKTLEEESKEEEEKEEPDRLSLLLPNSKFDCVGKITGYYADEDLGCEVFHYCQDNTKHSWICPEGFTFHQVHLICMPPSNENICEQSSRFHFVNDYLYKPLNVEEHQSKPNVTLRYSDRYFPNAYHDEDDGERQAAQQIPRKQPIQVGFQKQQLQQVQPQLIITRQRPPQHSQHFQPTLRPETHLVRPQHGQVFHSPEEVNISLQQRRPFVFNQRPSYQQRNNKDHEIEYE